MDNIEDLRQHFAMESQRHVKAHKQDLLDHMNYRPNEPFPEHVIDDFNVSNALEMMCNEIIKLRKQIPHQKDMPM